MINYIDRDILINLNSSELTSSGTPKIPNADEIYHGEIAINYATGYETIAIKNDNNEIVKFSSDQQIETSVSEQLSEKMDTISVIEMQDGDKDVTLLPNILYVWEEVDELNLSLEEPEDSSIYSEYMVQFKSGNTPTTLSLPEDITWFQDNNVISANKTYQISIVNNLAVLGEF